MRDLTFHAINGLKASVYLGLNREEALRKIRQFIDSAPRPVVITVPEHGAVIVLRSRQKADLDRFAAICWETSWEEPIELKAEKYPFSLKIKHHFPEKTR